MVMRSNVGGGFENYLLALTIDVDINVLGEIGVVFAPHRAAGCGLRASRGHSRRPSAKALKRCCFYVLFARRLTSSAGRKKNLPGGSPVDFAQWEAQMRGVGRGAATPRPRFDPLSRQRQKEYATLNMAIYCTDRDVVDPVFFAVVPDSFMTRESNGRAVSRATWDGPLLDDEPDQPLIAPHDRWSF